MMGLRPFIVVCFVLLVGGLAYGAPLDDGGSARVIDIIDGDTVLLDTEFEGSNEVRLVGIQAPKLPLGRKGFKPWPLADESKARLESLVLGQEVALKFGGRRMDRHGRLLAHLYLPGGEWVQGAMLAAGMARVYSFPDNRAVVAEMLEKEKQARGRNLGIWDHPYFHLRAPESVKELIGTFQLIEGVVFDAATVRQRTYLNFADDWRTDFTISLNKQARRLFTDAGIDPLILKGKRIRVRGWLKKRNGPMIEATHPEQIEILTD